MPRRIGSLSACPASTRDNASARRLVQSGAAYEEFAGICHHSLTLFATRLYLIQKPPGHLAARFDMKTTAIPLTRLQLPSRAGLTTRLPHFVALMKPRVMVLAVFTAFAGMMIAPSRLDPLLGFIAILAI